MFANSTCFDDDLMKKMAAAVAALKEGAIVITTTDPVPSPALEVLEEVSAKGRGGLTGWVASSFFFCLPFRSSTIHTCSLPFTFTHLLTLAFSFCSEFYLQ